MPLKRRPEHRQGLQRHPFAAGDPVLLVGGCDWNEQAISLTKQEERNKR